MNEKKVGIVVVTFNRKKLLLNTLNAIADQSYGNYKVIIIDNASTDGTEEYIKAFLNDNPRFKYKKMEHNTGGSGGFYEGVKMAYQEGADYVWGMDDDAVPERNALKVLVETEGMSAEKVCLVSYTTNNLSESNLQAIHEKEPLLIEKEHFLFLGFFVSRELIEKIGYPRKDLFIYFDDIDYSNRAKEAGYKIYKVRDSFIQHPDMMQNSKKFTILGKKFDVQEMPKWKWYYYMRNAQLVFPRKLSKNKQFHKSLLKKLIGVLWAYPKCFSAAFQGYVDGICGKSGKSKKF